MKKFNSEIDGKRISDFQQYDSSINNYKDRLEVVERLLSDENGDLDEFMSVYFSNYYNASPSQQGWLAEQDVVCKTVEGLGTYLLNSKDINSNRKVKYRFWKSEKEFKKYKESQNINTSTLETGLDEGVEVIDLFYSNDEKNYMLETNQKLFARDIKEIKEIRLLQEGIDRIREDGFIERVEDVIDGILPTIKDEKDLSRLKYIRKNVKNYVGQWSTNMVDNQILIKEAIKSPIRFKNPLKGEGVANKLDEVLFSDEEVNKKLITMIGREEDLMSDIGVILYDFNQLLDRANLTTRQREIVSLFRQGYSKRELPNALNVNKSAIGDAIGRLSKRVAKFYVKDLYEKALKNNL